jgi:ribosomal protein S27AE/DNA-binding transcriptional regulator YhcF (GntR family)
MSTICEPSPVAEQQALLASGDALGRAVILDNLQCGFIQYASAIFCHPDISRRAKLVDGALLHHSRQKDDCWPGQQLLARECSMSVDTVQRALKELRSYKVSVDAESNAIKIELDCPECTARQRLEINPRKRELIRCEQHQMGLVEWKQRGLNKTNFYRIVPLYSSLGALEEKLATEAASQAEQSTTEEAASGKPQYPVSSSRTTLDDKTAPSGTNHIEEEQIQGKDGFSNSNGSADSKGTVSPPPPTCSHIAHGTIGSTEDAEERNDTVSNIESNLPLSNEENGAGAARVKEVEKQRIEEHTQLVRALAAAGIPQEHWHQLDAAHEQPAEETPSLPISAMVRQMITWFSQDLYDVEHTTSNITHTARIYRFCQEVYGDDEEKFVAFLYTARAKAKKAVMQDRNAAGKPARMKYFFTCLENDTAYRQPCPKCGQSSRAAVSEQAAVGYQWDCGRCHYQFTLAPNNEQ